MPINPPHKPHRAGQVSKSLIVAQIDRDYLYEKDPKDWTSKVGMRWIITAQEVRELFPNATQTGLQKTRFRCLDDDREVYYGGWLYNDDDCAVQSQVSLWATHDSGAIHIQVKIDGEWVYQIG